MGEFRMPSLGADMEEGTIVEWRVAPGDRVRHGDVIAVVDTDKSDIDAEVFEDGVIGDLLVPAGQTVPVGTVLATILAEGAAEVPAPTTQAPTPPAAPERPATTHRPVAPTHARVTSPLVRHLAERLGVDTKGIASHRPGGLVTRADVEAAARGPARPRTSPRARRLARQRGVDLTLVQGTGPGGAVVGVDVERAGPPPPRDHEAGMRRRISTLMERSNREIPHYWVERDLDLGAAVAWVGEHNAGRPPNQRVVVSALLMAATARAAAEAPTLNGHWIDGERRPAASVDLGVIVVLRNGGLLAPVVHDAQHLTVDELMVRMADVTRRARGDHLRASDLGTPSITVSNLGDQGADAVYGVIHPPQLALVGYGRVVERPWAVDGMLDVRPVVRATIAGDHRASEGHAASRFLAAVDHLLQEPHRLEETS